LETQKKARSQVTSAGFEDEKAAREAVLDPEEQQALDQEISDYRREHHAISQRIVELDREVGEEEITEDVLARAEREVSKLRQDHEEGLKNQAALHQQIKEREQQIQKAADLSRERESLSQKHAVFRRLADDLRSEHFQAFLLEEAFRELVHGASERLIKLSGRYALEYRNDSFHVLDNDNAGERRSADTLSGGETFLASLALALELSEQVQRASGAVNLDSLFIDEGFGTLDPETLETVTAAIESLPVSGRMVGIITHIPELTERLPAAIHVKKSVEGSRLRQELV
jgi:exonuclease SbcC